MPKRFRSTKPFVQRKLRRIAGTAAAGTLGYIAGGSRGARFAGRAAWGHLGPRRASPRARDLARRLDRLRQRKRSHRSVGDAQMSFCRAWTSKRRYRLPKGMKRMLGARFIRSITATRLEAPSGGQQSTANVNLFTNGLATFPYAMGNADTEAMGVNLFADAPATGISPFTLKWKIERLVIESRIKNMTNVPVQIRLYDMVVRRDAVAATNDPLTAWTQGLTDEAAPGVGSTLGRAFPGAEPFESRFFCETFKVLKKTTFHLGPGSEHLHKISGNPPYINDRSLTSRYSWLAKRTRFLMIVVEGGVTDQGPVPAPFGVNYSKHAVDIVTEYKVKFYGLEKSRTIYSAFTDLVNILAGNEMTITEDTDAATPVVIA